MTLSKIPENVVVNTYKPDTKAKTDDVTDKTKQSEVMSTKNTHASDKIEVTAERSNAKAKQTISSDDTVSVSVNFEMIYRT